MNGSQAYLTAGPILQTNLEQVKEWEVSEVKKAGAGTTNGRQKFESCG